jgi:hypothetical protein
MLISIGFFFYIQMTTVMRRPSATSNDIRIGNHRRSSYTTPGDSPPSSPVQTGSRSTRACCFCWCCCCTCSWWMHDVTTFAFHVILSSLLNDLDQTNVHTKIVPSIVTVFQRKMHTHKIELLIWLQCWDEFNFHYYLVMFDLGMFLWNAFMIYSEMILLGGTL